MNCGPSWRICGAKQSASGAISHHRETFFSDWSRSVDLPGTFTVPVFDLPQSIQMVPQLGAATRQDLHGRHDPNEPSEPQRLRVQLGSLIHQELYEWVQSHACCALQSGLSPVVGRIDVGAQRQKPLYRRWLVRPHCPVQRRALIDAPSSVDIRAQLYQGND